jgi:hypothetical protein
MANSSVTRNFFQSSDVLLNLSTQLPLDDVGVLDHRGDATHFIFTEISRLDLRRNAGSRADLHGNLVSDPVEIS